ncbi:MAG: 30S ribosomal protein S6 [Clostridia bacterium]|nr:30S ribosomal protein S6 [Clostridia bacterium]
MVKTNKYETIFIVDMTKGEEAVNALVEKFTSLISSAGEVAKVDAWGKRRLAYEIDDLNEGYYVLVEFTANPEFPAELNRQFKITDGILRYLVIKQED